MLFYAIYLRIAQYDVTLNRYLVVVFGILLLGITCYFILSQKKSLFVLPFSFFITLILISFGPWSIYSYPQNRQMQRLITHLEKANLYLHGAISV
jgi:hypothetical protein